MPLFTAPGSGAQSGFTAGAIELIDRAAPTPRPTRPEDEVAGVHRLDHEVVVLDGELVGAEAVGDVRRMLDDAQRRPRPGREQGPLSQIQRFALGPSPVLFALPSGCFSTCGPSGVGVLVFVGVGVSVAVGVGVGVFVGASTKLMLAPKHKPATVTTGLQLCTSVNVSSATAPSSSARGTRPAVAPGGMSYVIRASVTCCPDVIMGPLARTLKQEMKLVCPGSDGSAFKSLSG